MRPIIIEGRQHTSTVVLMVISLALAVLLAYWSGDWSNVPINLGYVAGTLGLAVWPLYVMGRHRRRQDKVLDSIRALYLLAIGDLMTGRGRAAKRRLQKIRSLERHWRFGASYLFRTVLFGYVVVSNFVLATIGQFLGYHMNSPFHPRGLSDTWAMWLHAPWMFVVAQRYSSVFRQLWTRHILNLDHGPSSMAIG
jgi:hypothetical protein